MSRTDYFLRRLLLVFPTFLGITILCFAITQLLPGGPVDQLMMRMRGMGAGGESVQAATGGAEMGQEAMEREREAFRKHFGFDQPILKQYWKWLWQERCGMLSRSYKFSNKTAWEMISQRFPISLVFGLSSFFLTYLVCIPLGVAKAVRHGSPFDMISSVIVFLGYAIPVFALGMLLKLFLCGTTEGFWDLFPASGFLSPNADSMTAFQRFRDLLWHLFLPVVCYMAGSFAMLTLLMKNSLLDQINSDYVRTVYAKGGSSRRALWCHALRNALIPIATGFGSVLSLLFAGSVIIERVFEIPGMGNLSMEAIVGRDYPVFMGILALTSILTLLGNVLSDFCYVIIDPRIQFS
jgi:microcin C transport system permease protein